MTEQEIITYLKENKNKGVIYDFMPSDVRCWCSEHRDEIIFNIYYSGSGWNGPCTIDCGERSVYCLVEDYELEPQFKPDWEEFEIDDDGCFEFEGKRYYYREDARFETENRNRFKGFGGWLFNNKTWCTNPQIINDIEGFEMISDNVTKNRICEPIIPTKIRFWIYRHNDIS